MKRIYLLLGAVAVALVATSAATPMALPKLTGTVGPGFTISLKRGLAPVKLLKAGKYTFVVSDKASIHNFQIEGPRPESGDHHRRLRRDQDRDAPAQGRHLQVLLRAAPELDARHLQGHVGGVSSIARGSGSTAPSAIRQAASSPVGRERIRYGRLSQRPMLAMSVRDGRAESVGCEWKTASS